MEDVLNQLGRWALTQADPFADLTRGASTMEPSGATGAKFEASLEGGGGKVRVRTEPLLRDLLVRLGAQHDNEALRDKLIFTLLHSRAGLNLEWLATDEPSDHFYHNLLLTLERAATLSPGLSFLFLNYVDLPLARAADRRHGYLELSGQKAVSRGEVTATYPFGKFGETAGPNGITADDRAHDLLWLDPGTRALALLTEMLPPGEGNANAPRVYQIIRDTIISLDAALTDLLRHVYGGKGHHADKPVDLTAESILPIFGSADLISLRFREGASVPKLPIEEQRYLFEAFAPGNPRLGRPLADLQDANRAIVPVLDLLLVETPSEPVDENDHFPYEWLEGWKRFFVLHYLTSIGRVFSMPLFVQGLKHPSTHTPIFRHDAAGSVANEFKTYLSIDAGSVSPRVRLVTAFRKKTLKMRRRSPEDDEEEAFIPNSPTAIPILGTVDAAPRFVARLRYTEDPENLMLWFPVDKEADIVLPIDPATGAMRMNEVKARFRTAFLGRGRLTREERELLRARPWKILPDDIFPQTERHFEQIDMNAPLPGSGRSRPDGVNDCGPDATPELRRPEEIIHLLRAFRGNEELVDDRDAYLLDELRRQTGASWEEEEDESMDLEETQRLSL